MECAAAVRATIAAAHTRGAKYVQFPLGSISIASTIVLGNGSVIGNVATPSTLNGVTLLGVGAPFLRLGITNSLANVGTVFNWTGPAGGTAFRIDGPAQGFGAQNIGINGGGSDGTGVGVAGTLLELRSHSRGMFENVTLANVQSGGTLLKLTCATAEFITGGDQAVLGTEGNCFRNLRGVVGAGAIGILLDGFLGSINDGFDTVRNMFENTYLLVSLSGGVGIDLRFCDQNEFRNTFMTGYGTNTQNHAAIRFNGVTTVPNNYTFPQNNVFTGQTDTGQYLFTDAFSPGPGNRVHHATLLDNQMVPRGNSLRGLTMEFQERGDFPRGGYITLGGARIVDRAFRNRFRNSQFLRSSATNFPNVISGGQMASGWFLYYNGTPTINAEIFVPPFDDPNVPGERTLRLSCTALGGMTTCFLAQGIGGLRAMDGRQVTVSATMRLPFGGAMNLEGGRAQLVFGTGGSPSPTEVVGLYQGDGALTAAWRRVSLTGYMSALTGKMRGTATDDGVLAGFGLPASTFVIDINAPQFETAASDTAYERLPFWMEKLGADTT